MRYFNRIDRRKFFVITLVVMVLIVMIAVNVALDQQMNFKEGNTSENDTYKYHIAMIGSNPADEFWTSVYKGAKKAGIRQECYVENFGATLAREYSVQELLEMAIAANVDGIILKAEFGDKMQGLIDEAEKLGIPVMTIQSDAPNSARISFVSSNNYALGETYGNQILEIIENDNNETNRKKRVTVLVDSSDESSIPNLIFSGIKEATASVSNDMELSTVVINSSGKFESEETVRNLILSGEYPDVIVCLSAIDTISAYQSVVDHNMVGEVAIVGYYSSNETLEGIKKGIIHATVSINAEEMGVVAIDGLYEFITEKYVSEYLSVTSELITSENVDEYIKKDSQEGSL